MSEKKRVWIVLALIGIWRTAAWPLPGDWTTYTCTRDIRDVLIAREDVWGATIGGLLRYSLADSSYARYTNADGLAGNQVLCIEDDNLGNLWLGTDGQGLSKFPLRTGQFEPPFLEFRGHRINCLRYHQDRLFVGTDTGISVFLPNKEPEPEIRETYHQLGRLRKDAAVLCIAVLEDTLWAGSEAGIAWASLRSVNLMDPDSWTSVAFPLGVRSITMVDSVLYAASKYGIYQRTGAQRWSTWGLADTPVSDLTHYDGSLYAATEVGIYRHRAGDDWAEITDENTSSLCGTANSGLWAGTVDGLGTLQRGVFLPLPGLSGLGAHSFTDIAVDERTGRVWFATARIGDYNTNGAWVFDGEQWIGIKDQLYAYERRSAVVTIVAVELDRWGRTWLGTWGGSLHVVDQTSWVGSLDDANSVLKNSDPTTPQQSYVVANEILRDPQGNMWISNYGRGVAVIDSCPPVQEAFYPLEDYNPLGTEFHGVAMCIDSSGAKWIGTYDTGFFMLDDGGTPFVPGDDHVLAFSASLNRELTSDKIEAVAADRDGVLWVGTDNGLNAILGTYSRAARRFEVQEWRTYTTDKGLGSNTVHAICVDAHNNKWIGTAKGLARIDPDGAVREVYTTANSKLVDDDVLSLAMDGSTGELWIGTARGISKYETYLGSGPSVLHPIVVYPSPFVLDGSQMTFRGLPSGSSVKIFTLAGELVKALRPDDIASDGPVWSGLNDLDYYVGSGIYFYLVTTPQGREFPPGKIAVINAVSQ